MDYREVTMTDPGKQTVAAEALRRACTALGLNPAAITVRWVWEEAKARQAGVRPGRVHALAEPIKGSTGWTDEGALLILLSVEQEGQDLANTVAHEARHIWQREVRGYHPARPGANGVTRGWLENDAAVWAGQQVGLWALPTTTGRFWT